MSTKKQGFTLIEMSIVLVIIGILVGLVLRNLGGQTSAARDSRRVADLGYVSNALSLYMTKFGYYPTSSNYDNLMNVLISSGILKNEIKDPGAGKKYGYVVCSSTGAGEGGHYILAAVLESSISQSPNLYSNALNSVPGDWTCNFGSGQTLSGGVTWNATSQCATNQNNILCIGN
jgi:prepilin-type N-terminal cleavage/methylation domain-containing protein